FPFCTPQFRPLTTAQATPTTRRPAPAIHHRDDQRTNLQDVSRMFPRELLLFEFWTFLLTIIPRGNTYVFTAKPRDAEASRTAKATSRDEPPLTTITGSSQ